MPVDAYELIIADQITSFTMADEILQDMPTIWVITHCSLVMPYGNIGSGTKP